MAVDSKLMVNLHLFSQNGAIGRLAVLHVMKVPEHERELAYVATVMMQN